MRVYSFVSALALAFEVITDQMSQIIGGNDIKKYSIRVDGVKSPDYPAI